MKFGATLVFASVTKNQESFDTMAKYNIRCRGRKIYSGLEEQEYFDVIEDLAVEFYTTGQPDPSEIETEIIGD